MNYYELESLSSNISKSKNWSPHRKNMYGPKILHSLHLPKAHHRSSRIRFIPLVTQVIEQLIYLENLTVQKTEIISKTVAFQTRIPQKLLIKGKENAGIFHILHENCWLERLDNDYQNIVLVVTGQLAGEFSFFSQDADGLKLHRLSFNKVGIFDLSFLQNASLYLPTLALKL
ncbi:MAG: hypothetical protein ACI31W_03875 [Lactococcus sp.]